MTDPEEQGPKLGLTRPSALAGFAVIGLVIGWSLRRIFGTVPAVGVLQTITLLAVGILLLVAARSMRKAREDPERRVSPHQAVNRLVLAKASALAGAAVSAGYLGHALSWIGASSEITTERVVRAVIAALAAALVMVGGLVLERACRIDDGDE